ncbi:MAG: hypothetical protein RIS76_702 [Verrucomicrobiota bacterium]
METPQAEWVNLLHFVRVTLREAAEILGILGATSKDRKADAGAWLYQEVYPSSASRSDQGATAR